ncbi:G-protein coupled receptor 4 [Hoplias malabaricus]|uniref:G-protein coupled receptor 4 n=1 Tax=Hoplias malabaricus TaxID=27720 RepID=UPI0034622751
MDIIPNISSLITPGISNVGNTCGIDFKQDSVFLPVMYGIFFIIGTPLNLMALFGLYRLVKAENVLPVYVINLLLADLIQLLTLPFWIDYYANEHYWRFGPRGCQFMGLFFYISIYAGIFFMCLIALERHMAIVRPLKFQSFRRLKSTWMIAIGIWVIIMVPPSVAFDSLFPKHNYTLCIEKYPSEASFITYRLITLTLSFILPLSFIVGLHCKTLRSLTTINALLSEEKRRIRGLLTLLVVIFVIVLGPYHFIGCVKYLGLLIHREACRWEKDIFVFYQLGRGLLSLNSLLDPVLYMFLRSDFRALVRSYLPCLRTASSLKSSCGTSDPLERATISTQD